MDRRKFLIRTSLAGLGMSLLPWGTMASSVTGSSFEILPLPEGESHIRHGLLNWQEQRGSFGPNWLQGIWKDRLFANGFDQSENDLSVMTVHVGTERLMISRDEQGIWLLAGQGKPVLLKHGQTVQLQDYSITLHEQELVSKGNQSHREHILLGLGGAWSFAGQQVKEQEAVWASSQLAATKLNKDTKLIQITKRST